MPCALILNEAISNAFIHAFKKGKEGRIEISLKRSDDGMVFIGVKDDGVGFPERIDINRADSLGLKLMRNLVHDQLKGKIQFKHDDGTGVIIEFKIFEEEVERCKE